MKPEYYTAPDGTQQVRNLPNPSGGFYSGPVSGAPATQAASTPTPAASTAAPAYSPQGGYQFGASSPSPQPVTTLSSLNGQKTVEQNTQDLQGLQQAYQFVDTSGKLQTTKAPSPEEAIKNAPNRDPQSGVMLVAPAGNPVLSSAVKGINDLITSGGATPEQQQQYSQAMDVQNDYFSAISSAEAALNSKNYQNMDFFINRAKGLQQQVVDSITQLNKDLKPLRESYIQSLTPGAKEQALAIKANDIKGQIDQFKISVEEDKYREYEAQTMGFAGGRASEIDIRSEFKLMRMNSELNTVLNELGLEQEIRKTQKEGAETQLGWLTDDFELQQKVQERLTANEDALFERADSLRGEAKDMLGTLVGMLQGVNPDTMPAQTRLQLQSLAAQSGVPFDILTQALKTQYQQQTFDNALKAAQEQRLSDSAKEGSAKTLEERNREASASMATQLNSIADDNGFIQPRDYAIAKRAWVTKGFASKDFDVLFSTYRDPKKKASEYLVAE